MVNTVKNGPLPPGWDIKYDPRARRNYFINYINKITTWEDPRQKHINVSVVNTQPQFTGAGEVYPPVEMSNGRPSPTPLRGHTAPIMGSHAIGHSTAVRVQETSFTNQTQLTDEAVAKIGAMFPTVSETHIRTLLLKYMKSLFPKADETIILDTLYAADDNLQSATDLLLSMGYEKRDTASTKSTPQRRVEIKAVTEKEMPTPPRVRNMEDKQKMRERLSSKYADLADQLISMALESTDYDEERAGHILDMTKDGSNGQHKAAKQTDSAHLTDKEEADSGPVASGGGAASVTVAPASTSAASHSGGEVLDSPSSSRTATTTEIGTSGNEVSTASESPRKETASTSLTASENSSSEDKKSSTEKSFSKVDAMISKRAKGKKEVPKVSRGTSTTEDKEFKSPFLSRTSGANPNRHRGPNDDLLLEDYVTWTGPNPGLLKGSSQTPFGSTRSRLNESKYTPLGPNPELRKGPKCGLAKGSIYSHLTASVIAGGVSCGK